MMLFDTIGIVVALMSYAGRLQFGVTATRELTPNVWSIADGIEEEMRLLLASVGASPTSEKSEIDSA